MRWFYLVSGLLLAGCGQSPTAPSTGSSAASPSPRSPTEERTLSNGLRLAVIYFAGSTNVSLFTFLPLGLLQDDPGRTQWAHLVEHLVIRTTVEENSATANAETMGDHMRLDWYGSTTNWHDGLTHHRRWLAGLPFKAESLQAEKPKVLSETQYTEKNFATYKFALAAWNQGVRHRRAHAAVRADIASAALPEVEAYRDGRLAVLSNTMVCVVGGVPPQQALAALEQELGGIQSAATNAARVTQLATADVEMTWDLDVRHLLLTWVLPDRRSTDYAALWLAAQVLSMRLAMDSSLNPLTGTALAGVDLTTPEQNCFYVTATLRAGSDEAKVREKLLSHVAQLAREELPAAHVQTMSSQAAEWILNVPDLAEVRKQTAQVAPAMLEMNLGLQWAAQRYRHPTQHAMLAQHLAVIRGSHIKAAAASYLAVNKVRSCWIRPAKTAPSAKSGK